MARLRILIVDGNPESRAALALAFSKLRCSVLSASSLAQGLAMLDSYPDCVVLDLVLHDGDGESILRKVRGSDGHGDDHANDHGDSPRPIVAVVTIETNANRLGGVARLRPDMLLLKPMDPEVVARLCLSEMEGRAGPESHEQH
jgi:CheY-like chemotaxis protein